MMKELRRILFYVLLGMLSGVLQAQNIDTTATYPTLNTGNTKVVEVNRVFDPWISDAGKINFLPVLDDTVVMLPHFEYYLSARPLVRLLPLRTIPPAKMGRAKGEKLVPFYTKLGFGNNLSPLAEVAYSGAYKDLLTYVLSLNHLSSWGRLALADEKLEVSAPFARTDIEATLRGVPRKKKIAYTVNGFFKHGYSSFYGGGDSLSRTVDTLWSKNLGRHKGGVRLELGTTRIDSSRFQYHLQTALDGYKDNFDVRELHLSAAMEGYKDFKYQRYGATLNIEHFGLRLGETKHPNTVSSLAPWVRLSGERWRVIAGVNLLYDANGAQSAMHVYPMGHISYDIIRQFFVPYFELDGRLEVADRWSVAEQNPYLFPLEKVWNTSRNMELRFGVKGKFTERFGFHTFGEYSLVDSMRFAVNGSHPIPLASGLVEQRLIAPMRSVYDRVAEIHLAAELHYALDTRMGVGGRFDYWKYSTIRQARPWHKPQWEGKLFANYNLRDKLYAGLNFRIAGGVFARDANDGVEELPVLTDLSLHLRYRFTAHFSLFSDLNNLLFNRAYIYKLYPTHRLQAYLGIILQY
ncbi:MAG: hypothetical protein ACTTKZ_06465 [Bacteroides sp.]